MTTESYSEPRLRELVAKALGMKPGEITGDTVITDYEQVGKILSNAFGRGIYLTFKITYDEVVALCERDGDCSECEMISHSTDRKPFIPPGGSIHADGHVCTMCGQGWVQFNDHFHLWQMASEQGLRDWIREAREARAYAESAW